jgi:hypothetical protein
MKKLLLRGSMLGLAAVAMPALAHHSFAMFESEKNMTLEGTVKEFQWTNPHTWIQLLVTGTDGKVTEWSIEGASPNGLRRQGWRAEVIKPGDKVTVTIRPLKSGEPGGALVNVTLPDGKVLGRAIAAGATSGD